MISELFSNLHHCSVSLSGQQLRKSRAPRALPCSQEGLQPAALSSTAAGVMLGTPQERPGGLSWVRTRRSQLPADHVSLAWGDPVAQPEQPG